MSWDEPIGDAVKMQPARLARWQVRRIRDLAQRCRSRESESLSIGIALDQASMAATLLGNRDVPHLSLRVRLYETSYAFALFAAGPTATRLRTRIIQRQASTDYMVRELSRDVRVGLGYLRHSLQTLEHVFDAEST